MASKYGFSSINKQLGVKSNSNSSPAGGAVSPIISARVTDIILNDEHPSFLELGGYSSIGTIFFFFEVFVKFI